MSHHQSIKRCVLSLLDFLLNSEIYLHKWMFVLCLFRHRGFSVNNRCRYGFIIIIIIIGLFLFYYFHTLTILFIDFININFYLFSHHNIVNWLKNNYNLMVYSGGWNELWSNSMFQLRFCRICLTLVKTLSLKHRIIWELLFYKAFVDRRESDKPCCWKWPFDICTCVVKWWKTFSLLYCTGRTGSDWMSWCVTCTVGSLSLKMENDLPVVIPMFL